jgi:glutamyl-Q tRNA(Asp) synthetase
LRKNSTGTGTTAELALVTDSELKPPGSQYRGRFAPSPTGPLHFGSLLAAAGSWLDARAAGGEWLLRIEDLDPPREPPGAVDDIRRALEAFGLVWDGEVMFQSRRGDAYEAALARLAADGWTYPCTCSRAQIEAANRRQGRAGSRIYPGTCRDRSGTSRTRILRVRTTEELLEVSDHLQGRFAQVLVSEVGDFVLRRREGYIAYQLAVVVDDHAQGITDVVRGIDLLDSTPRQLWLQRLLGFTTPRYMHLPVVVRPDGEKLSKQTGAAGVDLRAAPALVQQVLACLGLELPAGLAGAPPAELWTWATPRWQPQQLAGRRSILAP